MRRLVYIFAAILFGAGCGLSLAVLAGRTPRVPLLGTRLDVYPAIPWIVPVAMVCAGLLIWFKDEIVEYLANRTGGPRTPANRPRYTPQKPSWKQLGNLPPAPSLDQAIFVSRALLECDDNTGAADAPGYLYSMLAQTYYPAERFPEDVRLSCLVYTLTAYSISNHADDLANSKTIAQILKALRMFNTPEAIEPVQALHRRLVQIKSQTGYGDRFNLTEAERIACEPENRAVERGLANLEANMAAYWRNHPRVIPLDTEALNQVMLSLIASTPYPDLANKWEAKADRLGFDYY